MFLRLLLFIASAFAAVDLNSADASALESLPGIGPSKAAAIVQYRTDHGPFKSVDELDNVAGIGPSTMANVRDLVTVGAPYAGAAKSAAPEASAAKPAAAAPEAVAKAPASTPAAESGCPVNINSADVTRLGDLPGIGASKAAAIFQYRTDNGAFSSCDGLDNVSGIGTATLTGLRDCCVVK